MSITLISQELLNRYLSARNYTAQDRRMFEQTISDIYHALTKNKIPRPYRKKSEILNVVGLPGAGKTTLVQKHLMTGTRINHSVMIDPDLVRAQLPFFKNAMDCNLRRGFDVQQADRETFQKWNPAAIYVTQSVVNRVHANGYNVVRCGTMDGPVTQDICRRTATAGFDVLNTVVVLAPLSVCRQSIAQRIKEGGHPVAESYLKSRFQEISSTLPQLIGHSDELQFYWRDSSQGNARLAATINSDGDLIVHNVDDAAALSDFLGEPIEGLPVWKNANRSRGYSKAQKGWDGP